MKRLGASSDTWTAKYAIIFYDYDLNEKNEIMLLSGAEIVDPRAGDGIFFKGLYLKDNR